MELKLSVNIGATLQVKNAKGEWDWIKPEVGCEVKLVDGEIKPDILQIQFAALWDDIVGPQFKNVVTELMSDPVAEIENTTTDDAEAATTEEDEYY